MTATAHVVVDWGTTSFRLWALDAAGQVLGERRSGEGLVAAGKIGFESVLDAHLAALAIPDEVPVMMCGMVGSRAGWVEATYLDAPIHLDHLAERSTPVPSARRRIRILPGLAQRDAARPDVMRGEETQLLHLALVDRHSGLVCLPGTHSKWVRLDQGAVVDFSTFMTGELFQLLRNGSVVAPAVEALGPVEPCGDFAGGVSATLQSPGLATNLFFALRADWLLRGGASDERLARLSGLLIGLELAGAVACYGSLSGAVLVAAGPAASLYRKALAVAGATGLKVLDAEDCVRRGLHRAATTSFGGTA